MAHGSTVIQGTFPNGVRALAARTQQSAQPFRRTPDWVLQRVTHNAAAPHVPAPTQKNWPTGTALLLEGDVCHAAAAAGQQMPPAVQQRMESFFGARFGDVRIHIGPQPASIGATAFTHGSHIHFAPGQYDAASPRMQHLLAHELAHVVQQRAGRVRNPFGSGVAVVHDALLEAEAERMAHRAAALQFKRRAPIQCQFVLTKSYRPRRGDIEVRMVGAPNIVDRLDTAKTYRVKGFTFDGRHVLYDATVGLEWLVDSNRHGDFDEVHVAPAPPEPSFVGFTDAGANRWEKQITPRGCWFAAMAVLCGKTHHQMLDRLKWKEDALYSITMREIPELGQLLTVPVERIDWKSPEALYSAVNSGKPVMLGVPDHVVVVYAVSMDKTLAAIWDPNGPQLKVWTMEQVSNYGDSAYVTRDRLH